MLVWVFKRYPCELRADFQQYYGLCLDDMGLSFSLRHAADLVVMLPCDSRVMTATNPSLSWGIQGGLLTLIANGINDLVWLNTKDAKTGRNRPERILPPGTEEESAVNGPRLSVEEYEQKLNMPRKEAKDVR